MQPSPKPGLDHGVDVLQALLDPILQPAQGDAQAIGAVTGFCGPQTIRTHLSEVKQLRARPRPLAAM
ncbi:hypothetical protein Axi01nite_95930 [Actinoplanes xinjiangensis]|nr:hypothetical protein Axi01nite_95930 [Actinoplanes xinjiangensis]